MSNYPFSNINPDQRRTVSMCLCVSWGPNDMGVHQRSPPNSLNSSIDLSPRVRGTESKKGPKIYKIHKSFEPNKLTRMSDPGLARLSDPGWNSTHHDQDLKKVLYISMTFWEYFLYQKLS